MKISDLRKLLSSIMVITMVIVALIGMVGCSSTKHVTSKKSSFDSSYIYSLQDSVKMLKQETYILNSELQKKDLTEVEFNCPPCPQVVLPDNINDLKNDSLKALVGYLKSKINEFNLINSLQQNTITKLKDGSIEYKGAISKYKNDNSYKDKIISELKKSNDSLSALNVNQNTSIAAKTEYKEVEKKVVVFPWYFWLITGAFAFLWLNKQFKLLA